MVTDHLALTLLGSYLTDAYNGDIRRNVDGVYGYRVLHGYR